MRKVVVAMLALLGLDALVGGTPGTLVAQQAVAGPIPPGRVAFGVGFDAATGTMDGSTSTFSPAAHLSWAAHFLHPIGHTTLVRLILRETRAGRSVLLTAAPIAVRGPVDGVWEDHALAAWERVFHAGAGIYTIRYVGRGVVLARGSFTLAPP